MLHMIEEDNGCRRDQAEDHVRFSQGRRWSRIAKISICTAIEIVATGLGIVTVMTSLIKDYLINF